MPKPFLDQLNKEVKGYQKQYSLNEGKAFALWYAVKSLGLSGTEAFEAISVDGPNDKGIDLFYIDHELGRILIGQLKYNARGSYKGKSDEVAGVLRTTDWLKDPEALKREGREDLETIALDYSKATERGFTTEYIYCYCGHPNRDVENTARHFNVAETGKAQPSTCRIANLSSLEAAHEERLAKSTRIDRAIVKVDPKASFEEHGAFGSAFITTLTGTQIRQLYLKHGDRLFDRNVRLFLGARKNSVNAGIRDTVGSSHERKNFWAYNNGITFICDSYDAGAGKIELENFSIVNGCQTTVAISESTPDAVKDVRVLCRFIDAPEGAIDKIISFTNSQNPIRGWDLSAQNPVQKRLKKDMERLPQPFLYILRKGEKLSASEKAKFKRTSGEKCFISFDKAAQYIAAFKGLPTVAYKDKSSVFSTYYNQLFPDQIRAEEVVLIWQASVIAAATVEKELKKALAEEKIDRISILKRGAKFFVVAAMAIVLHERNGKTFLNSLKAEVAVSIATEERLRRYTNVALEWYVDAMQELIDGGTEASTAVRNPQTWGKIQDKVIRKWSVQKQSLKWVEDALPRF